MKKSNRCMHYLFLLVSIAFLLALAGCGTTVLKGVFMDGPVAGLNYATPTVKGVTNADGIFGYKEGETVDFFIGDLLLGKTIGKPIVTPLDIVKDAKGAGDQRVANICVLLQTLDQDGNAGNGIVITEKVSSVVSQYGKEINFDKDVRAFSFDSGFRTVMSELNNVDAFGDVPRAVMPAKNAQKHFEDSLAKLKGNK